jgi:hypothetical protein
MAASKNRQLVNDVLPSVARYLFLCANQPNGAKFVAPLRPVLTSDVAAMPPSGG